MAGLCRRAVGLSVLALLLAASQLLAADSYWQQLSGLPTRTVAALAQTRDGYLWIGTYEGLFRYDGVTYSRLDSRRVPTWHDLTVTALYEAPDGTLWIGHERGGVSAYKDGVFTEYPARTGWKADRFHAITSDKDGGVWLLDSRGELARVGDDLVLHPEWGGRDNTWAMVRSRDQRVWVVNGGRLSELVGTELRVVAAPPGCGNVVQGVAADPAGGLWALADGRLWHTSGAGWTGGEDRFELGDAPLSTALATANGTLYFGTYDRGVLALRPEDPRGARLFGVGTGLPSAWVLASCEDHEGGVWLGSGSAGLLRLQHRQVSMLAPPDAWQGRSVLTMCSTREGGFLVGTEGAGLYRCSKDGTWTAFAAAAGLRNNYVWAVQEGADGTVWAGTWLGLDRATGARFQTAPGTGGFDEPTLCLVPARRGGFWIGSRAGLARYEDGHIRWVEPEKARKLRDIRNILEARDGSLWVSTNGSGIGRVRDGVVRQYLHGDGLGSDFTHGLLLDDNDDLWIGTRGGGLNRFRAGQFAIVDTANGLGSDSISQIEDDGLGYLWMSSRAGLLRVSKTELNACADGRLQQVQCLVYGPTEGLTTLSCSNSQPAPGIRAPDGRLVFATDTGLALVDPRTARMNTKEPPVAIESLRYGEEEEVRAPFPPVVKLGPGAKRLEIRYTGLSFALPEKVRFRCLLGGFDPDWVNLGGERRVVYSYLPPGRYTFQVTAANNDGIWNPRGRMLTIVVQPHFWQTLWFRVLLGIFAAGTVACLVWFQARRRLLRRVVHLERERAIDAERTRIANDMHDDIGAGLTRINMLAGTARADLEDRARVERVLAQIHETARGVTRAVDEIVWAVNPRHDTLESLINYLERVAQNMLEAAQLQCRLDLPVETPAWQPSSEVRHHLVLAFKEALSNAVRHSGCRRVTVSLTLTPGGCTLQVADDGHGIAAAGAAAEPGRVAAGNGIPGMHRRLAQIGGTCAIRSGAAGGTEVEFFVPAAVMARRAP